MMPTRFILKIEQAARWAQAVGAGVYTGAPVDHADGFIHFSAPDQLKETLARHFAGQRDLLLIAVDPAVLGEALKWEPSRGGALFPHLHGPLTTASVAAVRPLPDDHDLSGFADWGCA